MMSREENIERGVDVTKKAIAANIEALGDLLETAMLRVSEAGDAIAQGEQNQAIGVMLDLDRQLEYALALHRAAIALHRAAR
jgi:hypothetical protein